MLIGSDLAPGTGEETTMRFKDKAVIITGGGGKIGKAYAIGFAKEGAKVALPDIASADHVVKAIRDMGGTAISMACDVSDEKSAKAMVDQVAKEFGSIDVLVNNAAYFMNVKKSPFWEMEVDEFDKAMAVNVRGSWLCAKEAFRPTETAGQRQDHQYLFRHSPQRRPGTSIMSPRRRAHRHDVRRCERGRRLQYRVNGEPRRRHRRALGGSGVQRQRVANRALKRVQVENDLIGTVLFLASSESDFMTGQLLNVDGGAHFVG
jgi:NAD(P)-dependent dehydrogenase (short-subunit alcohol dehydrogenase family)